MYLSYLDMLSRYLSNFSETTQRNPTLSTVQHKIHPKVQLVSETHPANTGRGRAFL